MSEPVRKVLAASFDLARRHNATKVWAAKVIEAELDRSGYVILPKDVLKHIKERALR